MIGVTLRAFYDMHHRHHSDVEVDAKVFVALGEYLPFIKR